MLFLEAENPDQDILFYINSPGGSVTAGMSIYDTMEYIKPDISTIVMGQAASMGSLLACAGKPSKRLILPHSRHMIHQPLGSAGGQATDVEIQAKELLRWKEVLIDIVAKHTGQDIDKLKVEMDRDNYMTAKESVEYGLADQVVENRG